MRWSAIAAEEGARLRVSGAFGECRSKAMAIAE
jgi:hypothetical protein